MAGIYLFVGECAARLLEVDRRVQVAAAARHWNALVAYVPGNLLGCAVGLGSGDVVCSWLVSRYQGW